MSSESAGSSPPRSLFSRLKASLYQQKNASFDEESAEGDVSYPLSPYPPAEATRAGRSIDVNCDEVLSDVLQHEEFSVPELGSGSIKDLPPFDDVTPYGVSAEQQKDLWRKEVDRLVKVVNDQDSVPRFSGMTRLANDSEDSYETLALLADKVWLAMNICFHDNEAAFLEHFERLHHDKGYKQSKEHLMARLKDDDENDGDKKITHQDSLAAQITTEEIFDFIDYLTALLAKVLCGAAYGKNFHNYVLAMLVRWSTKLKIVSTNLELFAEKSLENAVHLRRKDEHGVKTGRKGNPESAEDNREPAQEQSSVRQGLMKEWSELLETMQGSRPSGPSREPELMLPNLETALKTKYYINASRYQKLLWTVFRYLVVSLRGTNRVLTFANSSYELCSVVYETGFSRFPTLVFQDRDEDFLGTSDLDVLNTVSYSAFKFLKLSVEQVQTNGPAVGSGPARPVGTEFSWSWNEAPEQKMQLSAMNDIISVLVPLQFTSPAAAVQLHETIRMIIFTMSPKERELSPIVPSEGKRFKAFFCLTTDVYKISAEGKKRQFATSLSKALMTRDKLLTGKQIGKIFPGTFPLDSEASSHTFRVRDRGKSRVPRVMKEIEEANKKMAEWVFEENGVMVACRLYVWSILASSMALVVGGVVIGLTVHDRIPGVDPFQFAAYCWVLAAFITLAAKSVLVESWSWRDFLLRRVYCRSVSELHDVTGINTQLILAKLLHDEDKTILSTRGPYNCAFIRKSGNGFSIDRPLSMWTMLISGLVMLRVQTPSGAALVCLDLRKGQRYALVSQENMPTEDDKYIYCDRLSLKDTKGSVPQRIQLKEETLGWHGVIGVYSIHDSLFV